MLVLSLFTLLLEVLLILMKGSYFGELAISFLPYIWLLSLFFLIYWLFQLRKKLYKPMEKWNLKTRCAPAFVLIFWALFRIFSGEVQQFYHQDLLSKEELKAPIRVLYSNIYEGNSNFEDIKQKILEEHPDILVFVEFSDQHKEGLKTFLDEHYPYMNTTTRSKIFVGSVVFSKFPITNLADDFKQGSRRYGYFKVEKDQTPYYFYEIHTASPVSKSFFERRNEQLQQLRSEFLTLHPASREKNAKIIMIGDFNISPWSNYYKDFARSLSGELQNSTRNFPFLFTWSLSEMLNVHHDFEFLPLWLRTVTGKLPLLRSHIDHLFISPNVNIQNLKSIQIPGSDHRGFVFDIE